MTPEQAVLKMLLALAGDIVGQKAKEDGMMFTMIYEKPEVERQLALNPGILEALDDLGPFSASLFDEITVAPPSYVDLGIPNVKMSAAVLNRGGEIVILLYHPYSKKEFIEKHYISVVTQAREALQNNTTTGFERN